MSYNTTVFDLMSHVTE